MKVLVMDDVLDIRKRVIELLSDVHGIDTIYESADPAETMAALEKHSPDIAILDIQVPPANNMRSGIDVLRAARKKYPALGFIMLTNFANPIYEAECKRLGADYFLDKSNEFEKVPDAVRELMKKAESAAQEI